MTTNVLASKFETSKVKKRFLTQMAGLKHFLEGHGFDCQFPINTFLVIKKDGQQVSVGILNRERRHTDDEMIFRVVLKGYDESHVAANQIRGVIRTLIRWGLMSQITDEEMEDAVSHAAIRCAYCAVQQRCFGAGYARFKQCRKCHEKDRGVDFPAYQGFYCCKECQVKDWKTHKSVCH